MSLTLTKLSETSSKITLGWTPVAGAIGYRFQSATQAPKWSHTWDATRDRVTFSKAAWYKVEALGVEAAGEYPPSTPPPTGQPIPSSGRITQGGTYSGTYTGATIVIDTSALVTITNAVINNTSGDVFRGLGGGFHIPKLTLDHATINGRVNRIFDAEGDGQEITVRNCTVEKTGGMKFSSMQSGKILVTRTRIHNIQGSVMGGPDLSQFTQFAEVGGATSIEVSWNEIVNDDPEGSFAEDLISLFKSSNAYIHDNYFYGQWTPGNPSASSQNPITIEETGASNNRIENNQIVACMGGVAINYNVGPNNVALNNRIVRSGFLPDGVTRTAAGYSGLVCFPGSPGRPYPQNGNHVHGNVVGFEGASGRIDYEDDDVPPDCLPLNQHYSGAVTMASERAEWDRWRAKLAAAGITVGA